MSSEALDAIAAHQGVRARNALDCLDVIATDPNESSARSKPAYNPHGTSVGLDMPPAASYSVHQLREYYDQHAVQDDAQYAKQVRMNFQQRGAFTERYQP